MIKYWGNFQDTATSTLATSLGYTVQYQNSGSWNVQSSANLGKNSMFVNTISTATWAGIQRQNFTLQDVDISANVDSSNGQRRIWLYARSGGFGGQGFPDHGYGIDMNITTMNLCYFFNNGFVTNLASTTVSTITNYTLRFVVRGNRLYGYYNDALLLTATHNTLTAAGFTGITCLNGSYYFNKLNVTNANTVIKGFR